MHEAGTNWRHRCYATDMIMVIASFMEIDTRQRLDHTKTRRRRHTNVNAIAADMQPSSDDTPIPLPIERQTPIRTPLSIVTSLTYIGDYSPISPTTSPESSFSAPAASSSSTSITRCPQCPKVFKGRYSKTNMRRHKRYAHGDEAKPSCPIPGCHAILSRSDNLGKHIRTVHGQAGGQR